MAQLPLGHNWNTEHNITTNHNNTITGLTSYYLKPKIANYRGQQYKQNWKETIFNGPGVARAVLKTPLSLIYSVILLFTIFKTW